MFDSKKPREGETSVINLLSLKMRISKQILDQKE